jgi:hypothetical protein
MLRVNIIIGQATIGCILTKEEERLIRQVQKNDRKKRHITNKASPGTSANDEAAVVR